MNQQNPYFLPTPEAPKNLSAVCALLLPATAAGCLHACSSHASAMGDDYWSTTKLYFLDVNAICMMWGRTIGQYHTIFFIVSTFFHVNEDYWSIFFWLTKQHGRHISFFIWNFQIWEMTIDRQRSCNSFDVYAMTRYGGGLLVNIFSIIYIFYTTWRLFIDIVFYRVKLGSVARMLPLR